MDDNWSKLTEHFKKARTFAHIGSLLNYDLETACPIKGVEEQGELVGLIFTELAKISQDPEYVRLLKANLEDPSLSPIRRRKVESELQQVELMEKMSLDEFAAYQKLKRDSNTAWKLAKPTGDFKAWLPSWEKLIQEERRVLSLLKKDYHETLYDVALDKYEPGSNQKQIDAVFNPLKAFLIKKIPETLEKQSKHKLISLKPYSIDSQKHLSYALLKLIGYDLDGGYLGVSVHPFSDFLGRNDNRITTSFQVEDWRANASTCLHEGGHAIQFQNWSDEEFDNYAAGITTAAQCETHSRFYENIVGRSKAFLPLFKKACAETLDPEFNSISDEDFYNLVNEVKPICNRCNSDELTYCLHIIIRYEIERDLINGDLDCKDVPGVWNKKYKEYLGVDVPNDREGCMQDVHWTDASIGYFPSYALGNMYGAQILEAMKKDLDFEATIASKDLSPIKKWFKEKDFAFDWMKPNDWIKKVTNSPLDPQFYINYLNQKY